MILVGLVIEVEGWLDNRIIFPALFPAPLLVALVLIVPTEMAVAADPLLEMKMLPPSAEVLEALAVACVLMAPLRVISPVATNDTGPAMPFKAVASVVMGPVTLRVG